MIAKTRIAVISSKRCTVASQPVDIGTVVVL